MERSVKTVTEHRQALVDFSVVIFVYFWVVVMFVCPNTRLTLSMGTPLLKARVANP